MRTTKRWIGPAWRGSTALVAAILSASANGQVVDVIELPKITVIGTTPLPGVGLGKDEIAAPVQTVDSAEIERSHAVDLTGHLSRFLGGVYVNEMQNNPFQPNLSYRGYTASPLLGTPQGLSVYLDGVRINQPFGDVVSWDIIPRSAISTMTLIPGSNPLFGLNTLGGALSIETKDGFTHPGGYAQAYYGSNARRAVEFEAGGNQDNNLNGYVTGNLFAENGWRDSSPTRVGQIFSKLGWRDTRTKVSLSAAYADTDLTGNGLQEQRFLARDYASVYTKPDETRNRAAFANLSAQRDLGSTYALVGNAYYRNIRTSTLNGDINDDSLTEAVYQPNAVERAALASAGYTGFPTSGENASNTPFPFWRCIANALLNSEPNEKCNGVLNRTSTDQRNYGVAGQLVSTAALFGMKNQWIVGGAYDRSAAHFIQSTQYGYLNPDRSVTPVDAFADGTQASENAFDARVDLDGTMRTTSAYGTDTLALGRTWNFTLSGRYNQTIVSNHDNLTPAGMPGSLEGRSTYQRFNPAVGMTFVPSPAFNGYVGYSEGNRAPSSIELGCADPANPCRLPNALAGDPPLKQVVAKTWEAGVRGRFADEVNWNAGVFRAENVDDILFVAGNQSGFGYFKNFGKTRRQGIELALDGRAGTFRFGANYTLLDATYQSAEIVNGGSNSAQDGPAPGFDGNITIVPGDRIALIPRHIGKAFVDWDITSQLSIQLDAQAVSSSYAVGNENNQHQPDGVYYLGPGKAPGHAVFNLGADYRPLAGFKFFVQIDNLFDRKYATAAQLSPTGFTDSGSFIARPFATPVIGGERPIVHATFYAPGAPRTVWVGVRYDFDWRRR